MNKTYLNKTANYSKEKPLSKIGVGVHQWLPGFMCGDAISNYAIALQKIIKSWGYSSEIFCPSKHISFAIRNLSIEWEKYKSYSDPKNIIIYHFSIGSDLSRAFRTIQDKKIIIYHNITPDKYFRSINAEKALVLHQGREELKQLHDAASLALADSEYNRMELEEWGYKNTGVVYPLINFNALSVKPKRSIMNRYKDDWTNILFVGRIAPNKKIENIIKVYYYYKNTVNPKSRLFIVGSWTGMEKYWDYLRALCLELDLGTVMFSGHVEQSELVAYYKLSDLFLCMSEHEGFGIPLVESMYFGIPIIAYDAAAVKYTLGDSGILVKNKDYPKIAELMEIVLKRNNLYKKVIEGQKKRLEDFSPSKIAESFKGYINNLT